MRFTTKHILVVGLILFVITAFTSKGYHHSDEHWQLLEFANFKLGRSPKYNLASEYGKEMRSAFQPGIAYVVIQCAERLGIKNPFDIALILRLISVVFAWLALSVVVLKSKNFGVSLTNQKLLACLSMLLWFIPYTACRFSNENWSGFLFCLGVVMLLKDREIKKMEFLLAGTLVGLSYLCRFQIAFAIVGLFIWLLFVKKVKFHSIALFMLGLLLIMFLGVELDKWFYGHYTFTAYHYYYANIVEGVAASFGVSPWWYYLKMILESAAAPLSVVLILGYFYSFFYTKTHLVHLVVFFFLVGHSIVGHKELRFLFPMIYFLPLILTLGYQGLQNNWSAVIKLKWVNIFFKLIVIENMILLLAIVFFKPAEETISFDQYVYELASNHAVTIFYAKDDPYKFGDQRQYFYYPQGLRLKKIENQARLNEYKKQNPSQLLLLYDPHFYPAEEIKMYIGQPVFKTFPEWVTNFNIGNWLGRAKSWSLYSVK